MKISVPLPKDSKIGLQICQRATSWGIGLDLSKDGGYILISVSDYLRYGTTIFGIPLGSELILASNSGIVDLEGERLRLEFKSKDRLVHIREDDPDFEYSVYILSYNGYSIKILCYPDKGFSQIIGITGDNEVITKFKTQFGI